jgi:phosphatidylserine/phosphatidylglycerophosphate/cardiolipin synthase-like enzyme
VEVAVIQRAAVRSELGRLQSAGCRVRIVVTRERVENWLQARVRLSDGRVVNLDNARVRTALLHDKVITIHALVGGREKYVVLAGTSNLTCGGLLYNDEMMVRLDDRWAYLTYERHFADVYAHAHQSPNPGDVPHQRACHPR